MLEPRQQIGEVGVDSGQLVICDPCYIDSEWDIEEFTMDQRFKSACTGKVYTFGEDFKNFEQPMGDHDGQTPNELCASKNWVKLEPLPAKKAFSYNACCKATTSNGGTGQLKYKKGHDGVGVVFRSGYGDGVYPVYAEKNEEGRVVRVTIEME